MAAPQFVIAVAQGALAASVSATLDALSIANRCARMLKRSQTSWQVVSTRKQVSLSGGMTLAAERIDPAHIPAHAVLIFPNMGLDYPGRDTGGDIRDRYREDHVLRRMDAPDARALARLAAAHHARGGKVAASCSGVLLLGMAGLLDGKTATTHWQLGGFVRKHFPQARLDINRMVVDDQRVITAGAALAQMDLMLYLLRRQMGKDVAEWVMKYLLIDSRATQARYRVWDSLHTEDDGIAARLEALIEASLPDIPAIAEAARQLHVTPKTLSRQVFRATGSTPMNLVHGVRMRHAMRLLSLADLPLEEIARRVGYANATSLRKLTLKMTRLPPAMLRQPVPVPKTCHP